MNDIKLEEKYITEYIEDMLMSMRIKNKDIENSKYHHNTDYKDTANVIRYGILSYNELARLNNRELSDKEKIILNDDAHVNGDNNVSLSVVGLDDLYRDELVYDPFSITQTDILISNDIKARRNTTNYGNEFLVEKMVEPKYFRSIDFRLLKYILNYKTNNSNFKTKEEQILNMISYYNCLKNIAKSLKEVKLDIPLREMSKENITLDIEQVAQTLKLVLK